MPSGTMHWMNAQINWSPDTYTLIIPTMMERRAAEYAGPRISAAFPNTDVEIEPGEVIRDDGGARAVHGFLQISTPNLFDLDPRAVKRTIEEIVDASVAAGDRDQARDSSQADQFLTALRSSD